MKKGFCFRCGKPLNPKELAFWEERYPDGLEEGSVGCFPCEAEEAAAENDALFEAESGVGLEKLREVAFERDFGG